MRRSNIDVAVPQAPQPGWRLVAKRTLNLAGRVVGPGAEISAEELAGMLNSNALLAGGHIAWCPPQAERPAPRAAAPAPAAPSPPDDVVEQCRSQLKRIAEKRRCTLREAIDLIDAEVLKRAIRQIAETPRETLLGSWGSGQPTKQRVGVGTLRRPVDDAIDILCREPEKEKAA
jgi:hypothetical protein